MTVEFQLEGRGRECPHKQATCFPGPLQGPTLRPFPKVPWGSQAGVGRLSSIFCPVIIRFADKWGLLIKGIKHVLPRVITVTVNQT